MSTLLLAYLAPTHLKNLPVHLQARMTTPHGTLITSMQDLSLEDSQRPASDGASKQLSPPAPTLARWPKLPPGWLEQDCYYVLGWDIHHPRLEELTRMHTPPGYFGISYSIRALEILELGSGWKHLNVCRVLPQDAPLPKVWDAPDSKAMSLVAIAFTATEQLYHRKPTKEQYLWLQQVFASRPQWYRDAYPKNYFYLHQID